MTTAEQVLARATAQIGTKERPAGSNRVLYSDWYGLAGPWCAMFVSWCLYQEGLPLPASTAKGFAYTPAGASWFRRQGRWTQRPARGHVVFFDFPGDDVHRISHVGLVESVEADGTVVTIEGNTDERGGRTGGQVMRRRRRTGIVGYGVPAYGAGVPAQGPQRRPGAPVAVPFDGRLLRRGDTGRTVRILQTRLVQLRVARLDPDGEYGPRTEAAVLAFQRSRRLEADGVVGPQTWRALWA
jgi:hypothetical protein